MVVKGAFVLEGGGGEDAVVGMVFLDCDAGFGVNGFKLTFALDGGVGVGRVLAKIEDVATGVSTKRLPHVNPCWSVVREV